MELTLFLSEKLLKDIERSKNFMAALDVLDNGSVSFRLDIARKIITGIRANTIRIIPISQKKRFGKRKMYEITIQIPIYIEEAEYEQTPV